MYLIIWRQLYCCCFLPFEYLKSLTHITFTIPRYLKEELCSIYLQYFKWQAFWVKIYILERYIITHLGMAVWSWKLHDTLDWPLSNRLLQIFDVFYRQNIETGSLANKAWLFHFKQLQFQSSSINQKMWSKGFQRAWFWIKVTKNIQPQHCHLQEVIVLKNTFYNQHDAYQWQ